MVYFLNNRRIVCNYPVPFGEKQTFLEKLYNSGNSYKRSYILYNGLKTVYIIFKMEEKKMKKILALVLAVLMVVCLFAGCDKKAAENNGEEGLKVIEPAFKDTAPTVANPYADIEDYDEKSEAIYNAIFKEFYDLQEAAKAATTVSERHALMALAEAKLLASGALLPIYSNGGNYAISRVAPYTAPNALFGNDSDRFHNVVVASEPITAAHREEMKAKFAELKGTGTYEAWAESFLVEKGYTLKDSYTFFYNSDPQTWDALATSKAADSEAIVNTYDGLIEYDCEGTAQPALAESWTISEDGLTYTFKIRPNVKWVDSQGRVIGTVTADDFVAGFQHMLDAAGGLEYLVEGVVAGAYEYNTGAITDFKEVGVKAVDELTLEYTLAQKAPYFMTMLSYNVFAPVNRAYFESKGGAFGDAYNPEAENYTYGKTPNDIAYCGPYLVTNATAKNIIVFTANTSYWNAANVNNKTITWKFTDGSDKLQAYNATMSGDVDGAGLNSSAVDQAKADNKFESLAYVSGNDATTFFAFLNVNRSAYSNIAGDPTTVVSTKDATAQERAVAAMYNRHFRLALVQAIDRGLYNEQSVGPDLKYTSLRNTYTPGNYVALTEDVTVDINGKATTFKANTYYGAIMQAQLDADGVAITAWDPTAEAGAGSSDGFDGWFNPAAARGHLAVAIEQLAAVGVEISAENPIYIDIPYVSSVDTNMKMANALKKSIEEALENKVIVNLVAAKDYTEAYYAGYYISDGSQANYDIYTFAGWGPDYGDPQTYLDTILPYYAGYMTMMLGIF